MLQPGWPLTAEAARAARGPSSDSRSPCTPVRTAAPGDGSHCARARPPPDHAALPPPRAPLAPATACPQRPSRPPDLTRPRAGLRDAQTAVSVRVSAGLAEYGAPRPGGHRTTGQDPDRAKGQKTCERGRGLPALTPTCWALGLCTRRDGLGPRARGRRVQRGASRWPSAERGPPRPCRRRRPAPSRCTPRHPRTPPGSVSRGDPDQRTPSLESCLRREAFLAPSLLPPFPGPPRFCGTRHHTTGGLPVSKVWSPPPAPMADAPLCLVHALQTSAEHVKSAEP